MKNATNFRMLPIWLKDNAELNMKFHYKDEHEISL